MNSPVFLLASPRSFTSVICAMLGQHPDMYGMPELNLFLADDVADLMRNIGKHGFLLHGLVRAIAQVFIGDQDQASIQWSQQWLSKNGHKTSKEIFEQFAAALSPRSIIDKSPAYIVDPRFLKRLHQIAPHAHFIHVVRHPIAQGASILKMENGLYLQMQNVFYRNGGTQNADPQHAWVRNQETIIEFLKAVPNHKKRTIRGEDIVTNPRAHLPNLCAWLGKRNDAAAIDMMLHPENSPFACLGPQGAEFGNDIKFLHNPALRPAQAVQSSLHAAPSWQPGGRLEAGTIGLARSFGYC